MATASLSAQLDRALAHMHSDHRANVKTAITDCVDSLSTEVDSFAPSATTAAKVKNAIEVALVEFAGDLASELR